MLRSYTSQPTRKMECSVRTLHSRSAKWNAPSVRCTAHPQNGTLRSYVAQPIRKVECSVRTLLSPSVKWNAPFVCCTADPQNGMVGSYVAQHNRKKKARKQILPGCSINGGGHRVHGHAHVLILRALHPLLRRSLL